MEEELQQLREMVQQLRADNEQLRQERAVPQDSDTAGPATAAVGNARSNPGAGIGGAAAERLFVVPRDRKCPMFNGKTGLRVLEWVEEVQACMRARHLAVGDQALFIFDHLEGEAKEEIRYRSSAERADPGRIFSILKELYGCTQSYMTLQQAFFSRQQQDGESLHEFSLALMALMEQVRQRAPDSMTNANILLRDQFVEHVLDSALRRELKQFIRQQPQATLLEVRSVAIRWEREGFPGGTRGRSFSLPSAYGIQYRVQGHPHSATQGHLHPVTQVSSQGGELSELKELLKQQQEQLNRLTQTVASLQNPSVPNKFPRSGPLICRRCQQPGHFARECDGERVPSRPRASSISGVSSGVTLPSQPQQQQGN